MQSDNLKNKITKLLCENIYEQRKKSHFSALAIYVIFIVFAIAVSYFIFAGICAFMLASELYKLIKLYRSSLYITYDLVKTAKGKLQHRGRGSRKAYVFDFGDGGKYIIPDTIATLKLSFDRADEKDPDKVALTYFEESEEFYLLVAEYKNKKKILQIFSLREFELKPADFEEKDGHYIVKE